MNLLLCVNIVIMSNYECKKCDYITSRKANYDRHMESSKHVNKGTKTFYKCRNCDCSFNSIQNRWDHEHGTCKSRQIEEKEDPKDKMINALLKELAIKNKQLEEQLKDGKEERKDFLDVIKNTSKATGKSVSTMAYVMKHYNKAPAMKKLTDKNAIKMLEYKGKELTSEEMMIHRYRNGTLDAYLGDIIKNAFIDADNPAKQSMWTSDVARLCFVIMYPISKGRREWIADKSGIKITELIIDPLLKNAKEMLIAYIKETGKLHDGTKELDDMIAISSSSSSNSEFDSEFDVESETSCSDSDNDASIRKKIKYDKSRMFDQSLVSNMQTAHDIRMIIDNKTLHEGVLKNICPFFKLKIGK